MWLFDIVSVVLLNFCGFMVFDVSDGTVCFSFGCGSGLLVYQICFLGLTVYLCLHGVVA